MQAVTRSQPNFFFWQLIPTKLLFVTSEIKNQTIMYGAAGMRTELTDTAAEHERQEDEDGGDEQHELPPRPPPRAEQLPQHPGVVVSSADAPGHHVPCGPRVRRAVRIGST
jgi:hypothetical protein